ncbi:MAG: DUF1385 domain-containing protein [Chloroflexi bacterium]|nr:DUF1385 domain-containing protein [Chloroflexota bacterium]
MRALTFSSNVSREPADAADEAVELPDTVFWGSIIIALGFMAALFFATPMLLSHGIERLGAGRVVAVTIEGAVRMAMFLGYIYLIGTIPGIRRVFQYHGAEHMAVHAHEAGAPLTIEGVRAYPKEHTRCGTSFLLVVMSVSVVTFFAFDLLADPSLIPRVASRVMFIPAIAAISYELLRLGAQHRDKSFVRTLFLPNIALQALTTRVPDDTQIEVAITSLEAVMAHVRSMPALVPVSDDAELGMAAAGD